MGSGCSNQRSTNVKDTAIVTNMKPKEHIDLARKRSEESIMDEVVGVGTSGGETTEQPSVSIGSMTINKVENVEEIVDLSQEASKALQKKSTKNMTSLLKGIMEEESVFEESVGDLGVAIAASTAKIQKDKLWNAVETNNTLQLDKILQQVPDLTEANLYDANGQTIIHKAASMGNIEALMMIIERTNAKPDILDANLATPLHVASRCNHLNIVKDEHGQTALLIACIHGYKPLVNLLIEASTAGDTPEKLDIDLKDVRGLTAFNCSAIKGDIDILKILVKSGADVDVTSPKGCTALMYASRGGKDEIVRYLLESKADPRKQDTSGGTVVHHAVEKSQEDILDILYEYAVDLDIPDKAGRPAIFDAVDNNYPNIVKSLINAGAKVNICDLAGHTPLYNACRDNNKYIMDILIECGKADINMYGPSKVDKEEYDGYECESEEEKLKMEGFKHTRAPIHVCALLGYEDLLISMINSDADINLKDNETNYAPLHFSILGRNPALAIVLIEYGVDTYITEYKKRDINGFISQYDTINEAAYIQAIENLKANGPSRLKQKKLESVIDNREIKGVQTKEEIEQLYSKNLEFADASQKQEQSIELTEDELKQASSDDFDTSIASIFGYNIAKALTCYSWKTKEKAINIIIKSYKNLKSGYDDILKACLIVVNNNCQEKVLKVFNVALDLFRDIVNSLKIEGINTFLTL